MKLFKPNVDKLEARGDYLALVRALHDKDWEIRSLAAKALGRLRSPGTVPALIEALDDKDGLVRLLAARALGRTGDERAVRALVQAFQDPDSNVGRRPRLRWASSERSRSSQWSRPWEIPGLSSVPEGSGSLLK